MTPTDDSLQKPNPKVNMAGMGNLPKPKDPLPMGPMKSQKLEKEKEKVEDDESDDDS